MYINYPKMVHMEGYESSDVVTLDFCMKKYRKHYCTEEKIHSRYFKILMRGIGYKNYSVWDVILLKKILPGSKFNIFTIKCRRQQARYNGWCKKRYLIGATKDVNLLVAIIGGRVEPYMFDKVFYSVDKHMVEALFEMDAVNLDQCDKLGNSAYSYYQYKMHPPVYTGGSSGRGGIR